MKPLSIPSLPEGYFNHAIDQFPVSGVVTNIWTTSIEINTRHWDFIQFENLILN